MLAIFSATYTPLKDWNIKANISAYTHDQTTKDRVKTYYLYDAEGNVAKTENLVSSLKDSKIIRPPKKARIAKAIQWSTLSIR